jgi:hypothetical protein
LDDLAIPESAESEAATLHPNLNQPAMVLAMAPLGLLDFASAYIVWSVVSIVCGISAIFLLWKSTSRKARGVDSLAFLGILLFAFFPTLVSIGLGQTSLLLLLLLSIVWTTSRMESDIGAGVALGLALIVKPFVGLLALFFLVRRRWRLLCWTFGTFALGTAVSLLVLGTKPFRDYLMALRSITWYASSWNASFLGFFTRILGGSENTPLVNLPWLAHVLSYTLSILGILALVWLAWPRQSENEPAVVDLGFGLALALMILISPLGWMYYFPVLVIPLVGAWNLASTHLGARHRWVLVVAWLLASVPTPLIQAAQFNEPLGWFTTGGVCFYALMVLSITLGTMLYRSRKGATRVPMEPAPGGGGVECG